MRQMQNAGGPPSPVSSIALRRGNSNGGCLLTLLPFLFVTILQVQPTLSALPARTVNCDRKRYEPEKETCGLNLSNFILQCQICRSVPMASCSLKYLPVSPRAAPALLQRPSILAPGISCAHPCLS